MYLLTPVIDGLAEREMKGNDTVVLPIWYEVSHDDVMDYSLSLAGRRAISTDGEMDEVLTAILLTLIPTLLILASIPNPTKYGDYPAHHGFMLSACCT